MNIKRRNFVLAGAMAPVVGQVRAAPNTVQLENANPGTFGWQISNYTTFFDWQVSNLGVDPYQEIEGYPSASSVNIGESIQFFVNCQEPTFNLKVFRLGWYGGAGARLMFETNLTGQKQVVPTADVLGTFECAWTNPFTLAVPSNWISGIYLVKLTAGTSNTQSFITFVVRDDARQSAFLFQSATSTAQAYNNWGGKSLYEFNSRGALKARAVSFNRPDADGGGAGHIFNWELSMVRFLEREGYDVTYCANMDVHVRPSTLLNHNAFLSVGHDEYWSYQQKTAVQNAQAAGVHLGFFGSNTCYWQIRLSASPLTGQANRTMTSYKEMAAVEDPYANGGGDARFITSNWRNMPTFVTDSVARPENGLLGVMYHGDPVNSDLIVADATHWIWANTGVAAGTRLPGLLGYETDSLFDNGYQPAGIKKICESPDAFGFSHVAYYTSASGGSVFATGTMQWSWGLDFFASWAPNSGSNRVNSAVQQATRNVFARFQLPALVAPTGVVVTAGAGQLSVNWTAVANATSYDIYRGLAPNVPLDTPYRTGVSAPSIIDTGLTNGTSYYYRVVARSGVAESLPSAEVTGKPNNTQTAQTITFPALGQKRVGDPAFTLSATASSGLPVTFSSLTPATVQVVGNVATIIAAGNAVITANQAGNAQYAAAPTITQTFVITGAGGKSPQTITFGALPSKKVGDPPFTLSATASSGLPVTFSTNTPSICSVVGNTVTILKAGNANIIANQVGNAQFLAAPAVTQQCVIGSRIAQTITFPAPGAKKANDPPFALTGTASSGLPITWSTSTPAVCSVVGNTVTIIAGGTATIIANQPGDGTYAPANAVSRNFTVNKVNQSLTFGTPANQKTNSPPFSPGGTATSGLPVTYSTSTPSICKISADGLTVTFATTGIASLTANQAGNGVYNPANSITRLFIVTAGTGGGTTVQPPTGLTGYSCDVGCWAAAQGLGIRINWTQSTTSGITQNGVWRGDGTTGALSLIATISAGTFYLDKAVVKGQTYHYRITAIASGGTSAQSNDTAVTF